MEKEFLEKFENNVNTLVNSGISFKNRLEKINWLLIQECDYWNKKGEDGIISKLKNFAGQAITISINNEIGSIKQREENLEKRKGALDEIKRLVSDIKWLTEGFKSGINVRLSFASIQ